MSISYWANVAIATTLTVALASCSGSRTTDVVSSDSSDADAQVSATDPCAGANPCAGDTSVSYFSDDGIAIRGADPVAYFTDGQVVIGTSEFEYEWNGTTWQFASAEHQDLFAESPEDYAPQYGGYCAWAVSQGNTAPIDPEAWRIVDGKLYLNYDLRIQERWAEDIEGNIAKADGNWPEVLDQ